MWPSYQWYLPRAFSQVKSTAPISGPPYHLIPLRPQLNRNYCIRHDVIQCSQTSPFLSNCYLIRLAIKWLWFKLPKRPSHCMADMYEPTNDLGGRKMEKRCFYILIRTKRQSLWKEVLPLICHTEDSFLILLLSCILILYKHWDHYIVCPPIIEKPIDLYVFQ